MRRFIFTLDNGTKLSVMPPTVRMYYKGLLIAKTDPELYRAVAEICSRNDEGIALSEESLIDNFTTDDLSRFMRDFPAWINDERSADPNS